MEFVCFMSFKRSGTCVGAGCVCVCVGGGVEYSTRGGRMKMETKLKQSKNKTKKYDEWSLLVQACSGVANMHNAQPCPPPRQSVPYIRTSIYTSQAMHTSRAINNFDNLI